MGKWFMTGYLASLVNTRWVCLFQEIGVAGTRIGLTLLLLNLTGTSWTGWLWNWLGLELGELQMSTFGKLLELDLAITGIVIGWY